MLGLLTNLGSSGGSAVAVQAEMCTAALGTDTGGSVRQPAAFTGTIGLKPSYGRISRYGVMSYASSFDQIGPISYSISDAAILLEVMSGKDPKDATSSSKKVEAYSALKPNEPKRIAYIEPEGLDDEVSKAYTYQIEKISASKHQLERISIDFADALVPTYYVLTTAEASSNLSRYAGMIYGHQSKKQNSLDEMIMQSRNEGFGPEVKRRIMTGTFILSEEHFEAYYTKALLVRRKIKNRLNEIFENFDAILSPTAPTVPFKLNEKKPMSRWIVFRKLTLENNLLIYTDSRSEKIKNLRKNSNCGILALCRESKLNSRTSKLISFTK